MKKLRRLCIYPNKDTEPKMHMLYECNGKSGTAASTVLWFLEPPVKGMSVYGIDMDSHYSPYMLGHSFRYAPFSSYIIDDIYSNGYVICHLN